MNDLNDFELLDLAAKAISKKVGHFDVGTAFNQDGKEFKRYGLTLDGDAVWNPLEDDGEALRLAVELELDIWFVEHDTVVLNACEGGGDPFNRTRRAIVRAAAAIGNSMP